MSRMKTDYIFSTVRKSGADSEAVRRAINAVQEVVRVSGGQDTSELEKARTAYLKAIDDAVDKFRRSKITLIIGRASSPAFCLYPTLAISQT